MVTSSESMAPHLHRGLPHALTVRRDPVHLDLPVDLWEKPLAEDSPGKIQDALRQALAVPGPTLIEVRVDPSVAPPLRDRVGAIRVRGGLR